jgi:hypothetical protein
LQQIFLYCKPQEILNLAPVSKRFYKVAYDPRIWKVFCQQFPSHFFPNLTTLPMGKDPSPLLYHQLLNGTRNIDKNRYLLRESCYPQGIIGLKACQDILVIVRGDRMIALYDPKTERLCKVIDAIKPDEKIGRQSYAASALYFAIVDSNLELKIWKWKTSEKAFILDLKEYDFFFSKFFVMEFCGDSLFLLEEGGGKLFKLDLQTKELLSVPFDTLLLFKVSDSSLLLVDYQRAFYRLNTNEMSINFIFRQLVFDKVFPVERFSATLAPVHFIFATVMHSGKGSYINIFEIGDKSWKQKYFYSPFEVISVFSRENIFWFETAQGIYKVNEGVIRPFFLYSQENFQKKFFIYLERFYVWVDERIEMIDFWATEREILKDIIERFSKSAASLNHARLSSLSERHQSGILRYFDTLLEKQALDCFSFSPTKSFEADIWQHASSELKLRAIKLYLEKG